MNPKCGVSACQNVCRGEVVAYSLSREEANASNNMKHSGKDASQSNGINLGVLVYHTTAVGQTDDV